MRRRPSSPSSWRWRHLCLLLCLSSSASLAQLRNPGQFQFRDEDNTLGDFDRGSVEAPPDVIVGTAQSTTQKLKAKARLSESHNYRFLKRAFNRGSVESGSRTYHLPPGGDVRFSLPQQQVYSHLPYYGAAAPGDTEPLEYYGAAERVYGQNGVDDDFAATDYSTFSSGNELEKKPLRESVEAIPERKHTLYVRNRIGGGSGYSDAASFKVVCYYSGWALYRKDPFTFTPSHVDPTLCTHLIYAFAGLEDNRIVALDEEKDLVGGYYKAAVGLKNKNPDLKVMIAIGGWNEGGKKYSDMVSKKGDRQKFVKSVVDFLEEHKFDGLDLDWEYPGSSDRDGKWSDRDNFVALVDELQEAFEKHAKETGHDRWLLSAAVPAPKFRVSEGYDVPKLAAKLDFINVMTYDLRGSWDGVVGNHAPLYQDSDDWSAKTLNVDFSMMNWHKQGAPKDKLIMGVPFYGRSFTLTSPNQNTPGSRSSGGGRPGKWTEEGGFMAYFEICNDLESGSGWMQKEDGKGGTYVVNGDQWIGYDTVGNIASKMDYIVSHGFGGAMIWAIDLDDFPGECNGGKWPLLSTINRKLRPTPLDEVVVEVEEKPKPKPTSKPVPKPTRPPKPTPPAEVVDPGYPEDIILVGEPQPKPEYPPAIDGGVPGGAGVAGCSGASAGIVPSNTECHVFYQCDGLGGGHESSCPNGLHFDTNLNTCNWPAAANCQARIQQNKASTRVALNSECFGAEDGLYSDPSDCAAMFWCVSGQQLRMRCPSSGQTFDPATASCSFYARSSCRPGGAPRRVGKQMSTPRHILGPDPQVLPAPYYFVPASQIPIAPSVITSLQEQQNGLNFNAYQRFQPKESNEVADRAGSKRVVCYFANWAGTREGDGTFVPENVDASLCSHLVYAFAGLDTADLELVPSAPRTDIESGYFNRVQTLARRSNPNVKVLLAIGGWTDSGTTAYSRLVTDNQNIKNFVVKAVDFLKTHGFDGLSFDWQYPVCHQSDCSKGDKMEKQGFTKLIKELRKAFDRENLLLSVSVAGYPSVLEEAYELDKIGQDADMVNVMTYDYRGFWDGKTGHHSPISDAAEVLALVAQKGVPKAKLNIGVPLYGQSFQLSSSDSSYGAPTTGRGEPGKYTLQAGMLAFYEICQGISSYQWTKSPGTAERGPYAHSRNQWVGYDDVESVKRKAEMVKEMGYGGATLWTIDLDDFNNLCCQGVNPILNAASSVLRGYSTSSPGDCSRPPPVSTPPPIPLETTPWDDGGEWKPEATAKPPSEWRPGYPDEQPVADKPRPERPPQKEEEEEEEESNDNGPPSQAGEKCSVEGEKFTHQSDCASYFVCLRGEKVKQPCAGGLYWNQLGYCDWKQNVDCRARDLAASGGVASGPPAPPSVVGEDEVVVDNDDDDDDDDNAIPSDCSAGEYAPVDGDCNAFTVCKDGARYKKRCAAGLHFVREKNSCDWPENSQCTDTQQPTRVSPPSSQWWTADNSYNSGGKCAEGKFEARGEFCQKYDWCIHGKWVEQQCPSGTVWKNGGCDFCGDTRKKCPSEEKDCPAPPPTSDTGNEIYPGGSIPGVGGGAGAGKPKPEYPVGQPKPTKPTTRPTVKPRPTYPPVKGWPAEHDYKVVCYFTNWAWYRPGVGKYKPEDIDPNLCTHVVYGFAVLDYSNLIIKAHDGWADFDNKFYEKVTALKKKGIKVTIAIGGWNDSQGDKYSRLVNNPSARSRFISHVVDFILKHNFDGLDLDWEYPSCWQTECKEERYKDRTAFTAWVRELKEAFAPHGLLLSAAVSPSKKIIDLGYEVDKIAEYMDWIAVMTYDYFGHWDKKTGHVSPMYHHPDIPVDYFNTNYTINYWIEKGAPPRKLVMGMPLYGQAFTINDPSNTGLNSPGSKGLAGQFTRAAGFLAYYEICHKVLQEGYQVVKDPKGRMGPYAHRGNQWVGYDDVEMITFKSEYVRKMGLGGGMIWALDLDDFNNRCGQGKHPLLTAIKDVLSVPKGQYPGITDGAGDDFMTGVQSGGGADQDDEDEDDEFAVIEAGNGDDDDDDDEDEDEDMGGDMDEDEDDNEVDSGSTSSGDDEYKVVCYFTNWAWYRPGLGKYTPDEIQSSLCTHIVYGFVVLDPTTLRMKPHDAWADLDNKFYEKVVSKKNKRKGRKVLLALGGWNDSAGDKYSRLVSNAGTRAAFIQHAVEFLRKYNFDGLDLDWEYPKCWQVACDKGPESDRENFALWIKELKEAFEPHGLLLTAAVSPSKTVVDNGYDVPATNRYLDYVSVMTYDYHGQWDKKTGHVAPMYDHPMNAKPFFNVNYTINYWIKQGLDPKKVILGMPMYGQSFTLAEANENGLQAKTYGGGEAGEFTRARGFLAYYEICDKVKNHGWKLVRDPESRMGPYAYKGDQWVGFDDVDTIAYKTKYVKEMGLGGAMIWALDLDDFTNRCGCEEYPLLKTINRGLGRIKGNGPSCAMVGNFRVQDTATKVLADVPTAPYSGCSAGNFRPDERDCTKYAVCDNGEYHDRVCPAGLHWNGRFACTWPADSGCKADGSKPGDDEANNVIGDERPVDRPDNKPEYPPAHEDNDDDDDDDDKDMIIGTMPTTGKKVVCYFTNWAWYRQEQGKYTPDDIDPNLCTHVMYGFAVLDPNTLKMKPHDTWADLDNKFYEKVTDLKKKGIKVLIALGGWNDSLGDKYSRLVTDPTARQIFINHAVQFIKSYNFDGLDLDWEYPKCWQVNCDRGPASDKENFAKWVSELRAAFKPHGFLLTAAVSPSKAVIDQAYDVPSLSRDLDIINVMTYDYHGHWDKKTGHVAPLKNYEGSTYDYFNAEYTMKYWVEKGADPQKLVMGIPMYGQAFSLADPSKNGLNEPAPQRGLQGEFTRAAGFLAYYEICKKIKNGGWTVVHHDREALGPYAFQGNQWVGFDDVAMVRRKSEFVRASGYGGAMIWALDLDDFRNVCGCEPHPLLRTINRVLRGYPVPDPKCDSLTYSSNDPFGFSSDFDLRGGHVQTYNNNPYQSLYSGFNPPRYAPFNTSPAAQIGGASTFGQPPFLSYFVGAQQQQQPSPAFQYSYTGKK